MNDERDRSSGGARQAAPRAPGSPVAMRRPDVVARAVARLPPISRALLPGAKRWLPSKAGRDLHPGGPTRERTGPSRRRGWLLELSVAIVALGIAMWALPTAVAPARGIEGLATVTIDAPAATSLARLVPMAAPAWTPTPPISPPSASATANVTPSGVAPEPTFIP